MTRSNDTVNKCKGVISKELTNQEQEILQHVIPAYALLVDNDIRALTEPPSALDIERSLVRLIGSLSQIIKPILICLDNFQVSLFCFCFFTRHTQLILVIYSIKKVKRLSGNHSKLYREQRCHKRAHYCHLGIIKAELY